MKKEWSFKLFFCNHLIQIFPEVVKNKVGWRYVVRSRHYPDSSFVSPVLPTKKRAIAKGKWTALKSYVDSQVCPVGITDWWNDNILYTNFSHQDLFGFSVGKLCWRYVVLKPREYLRKRFKSRRNILSSGGYGYEQLKLFDAQGQVFTCGVEHQLIQFLNGRPLLINKFLV